MSKDFVTEEELEREFSERGLPNGSTVVVTPEHVTTTVENAINAHKEELKKAEEAKEAEENKPVKP